MVHSSVREERTRGWRTEGEKGWQNRLARTPFATRCREICRDLHGRLASLAPRERVSENLPLSPFSGVNPWPTEFSLPPSCPQPLTLARAGVACRIKKAFAKSQCLPERCKIETMGPLPAYLFILQICSSFFSFLLFFYHPFCR